MPFSSSTSPAAKQGSLTPLRFAFPSPEHRDALRIQQAGGPGAEARRVPLLLVENLPEQPRTGPRPGVGGLDQNFEFSIHSKDGKRVELPLNGRRDGTRPARLWASSASARTLPRRSTGKAQINAAKIRLERRQGTVTPSHPPPPSHPPSPPSTPLHTLHPPPLQGNFLASMSHEMRTPLNGVLGMLQVRERNQPSTLHPPPSTLHPTTHPLALLHTHRTPLDACYSSR